MLSTIERLPTFTAAHATPEETATLRNVIEKFLAEERRKSL